MKNIAEMVELIDDELCGAKDYAERYVYNKAAGNSTRASAYKGMASSELEHADILHGFVVEDIEQVRKVFTPPADMLDKWNTAHAEYVEKAAWIKQMLSM